MVGLGWVGLGQVGLGRVGLGWMGSDWVGPGRDRLGRAGLGWVGPGLGLRQQPTLWSDVFQAERGWGDFDDNDYVKDDEDEPRQG